MQASHTTRRALVIGAQTFGLGGVHHDVDAITTRLAARGFEIDRRVGELATRAGILDGLERLIGASEPGDAALVYYSGHGARFSQPGVARRLQCLVAWDWSPREFRGVLDVELSLALARLTAKTTNVALVLDCCHSGRMARRVGAARVRTLGRDELGDFEFAALALPTTDQLDAEANPHAIKLVAAEVDGFAFEEPVRLDGELRSMGLMTAALCKVLDELEGSRVTWRSVATLVRERVMGLEPTQRPELEGPGRRYLFEHAVATREAGVAYFEQQGQPCLRVSALLGAELGQHFRVMPPGVDEPGATPLASATITELGPTWARVQLEPAETRPPLGCLAFASAPLRGRMAVGLQGDDEALLEQLRRELGGSAWLRVVDGNEAELRVELAGGRFVLWRGEAELSHATPLDEAGRRTLLARLGRWARAELLRKLDGDGLVGTHAIELGRVVAGSRVRLGPDDALHAGDAIYVEVRNTSRHPLFAAVLNVGIDGEVTLLSRSEPSGIRLEPGQAYALGLELGAEGLELEWPDEVPRGHALRETLMVIVASGRHDFAVWETPAEGGRNVVLRRVEPPQGMAIHRLDVITSPLARQA